MWHGVCYIAVSRMIFSVMRLGRFSYCAIQLKQNDVGLGWCCLIADILDATQVNEADIVAEVVGVITLVVICVLELVVVVGEAFVTELVLTEIEPALVA